MLFIGFGMRSRDATIRAFGTKPVQMMRFRVYGLGFRAICSGSIASGESLEEVQWDCQRFTLSPKP